MANQQERVVEWAERGLADWQKGDADYYVSENGHPSWENIIGYILEVDALLKEKETNNG